MSATFKFNSPEGFTLCRQILKNLMPHDTHDWQLEAITRLLDKDDVLLITATGSGKTDAFIRLMHIVKFLSENPKHVAGSCFPNDPAMIVICPTKALEEEMEKRMNAANLRAVAINSDRVAEAQKDNCTGSLFEDVKRGVTVVLVSPEQLKSARFEAVLQDPHFAQRVCMMAVDEAHLMNSWGQTFRKDYQQTGFVRARLARWLPLLAVTATIQAGAPTMKVCMFLGFKDGQYHIIRRSNMRHDIRMIFRTLRSGIGGTSFWQLDWVLSERERKVLIFCKTINLGFRIDAYLWHNAGGDLVTRAKRIRMFNALNWKSYNDETFSLWKQDDPHVQIVIATSILSVGIDAPCFDDVIIFGEPDDVDEYWQELGRIRPRGHVHVELMVLETMYCLEHVL